MKLQVALDRISLAQATVWAKSLDGIVDVIELGTSLIKDFGLQNLVDIKAQISHSELLMDLKTMDEAQYEFEQGFKANADILTVMGAASKASIVDCYQVTRDQHKAMMIDLMEVTPERIQTITNFDEAYYCLHHSTDAGKNNSVLDDVASFHQQFPEIKRIAVAGGIDLETAKQLKAQGIAELVIVGGKITKAPNLVEAAQAFKEAVK